MNNAPILLPNLSPRQQEAVKSPINRPLLIVAGAGSGKTATLTARLRFLIQSGVPSSQIVAITFTNKAADEMRRRLADVLISSPPFIGTFHAFGAKILRSEARLVGRSSNFTIFDSSDSARLLRRVLKNFYLDKHLDKKEYGYSFFASRLSDIKNNLLDSAALSASSSLEDRLAGDAFSRYELTLTENNGFDFDDLIEKVVSVFRRHPEVLEKYRAAHSHLLVDEYQDVNHAQYTLVKLLAGDAGHLNVVGDDNQAIYGFRGADFKNFLNFDRDFKNTQVVILDQNYRSTKKIIGGASTLIKNNSHQRPKTLWTDNVAGDPISLSEHEDEESEAGWLSASARPLLKSGESLAVLYRTNAQSRPLEQSFIEEGIPYQIFGGLKFYERKEIKDLVATLLFAHNPSDSLSSERIMKNFYKKEARELLETLPAKSGALSPADLITYVIKTSDYLSQLQRNFPNFYERSENISELISFASGFPSLGEFLEAVSLFQSSDSAPKKKSKKEIFGQINLMTIHLSKGLEFDNVFAVGVTEGLLPHSMSYHEDGGLEEERRLMYVAMTRAKKRLFLSFYNIPSRFLSEISPEYLHFENGSDLDDLNSEKRYISI